MKKILLTVAVNLLFVAAFAQKISKITMSQDGNIESIYLLLDDNVTINISKDGNVSGWGVEVYSDRIPYPK